MALGPALLNRVARSDYQSDIFLGGHPPQISKAFLEWSLASNNLAIIDIAQRAIDEVSIDIAIEKLFAPFLFFCSVGGEWHAGAGDEVHTRMLVGQDVYIAILRSDVTSVEAHVILDFGVGAVCEGHELRLMVFDLSPLRHGYGFLEVASVASFLLLPDLI